MGDPLRRPGPHDRLFPPVGDPDPPGAQPDPDSPRARAARAILALAEGRGLNRVQRLAGAGLNPRGRVQRLLHVHRLAREAEAAGETVRADFFWARFQDLLPRVAQDAACRGALAELATGVEVASPQALLHRLVDEVFVDTHLGFYNGRTPAGGPPDDRALLHLVHAERLLRWSGMSPDERQVLEGAITLARVEHATAAGRWSDAVAACTHLVQRAPHDPAYQDRWVECMLHGALAGLHPGGNPAYTGSEAAVLDWAIARLNDFRGRHPGAESAYPALARLHAAHAVRLAAAHNLPDALVSMARALAFCPWLQDGEALADQLSGQMHELLATARGGAIDLRRSPGTGRNSGRAQMRMQAQRGFRPLQAFLDSGEADRIAQARRMATGIRLWRGVAPGEPGDDAEARARALVEALDRVLGDPPAQAAGLAGAWAAAVKDEPELAGRDPAPVLAWLRGQLFPDHADAAAPPAPPAPAPRAQAPRLPSGRRRWRRSEPFGYWLFTPGNARLKLQAAAAVLLLLGFGVVWGREAVHLKRRAGAYEEALAAQAAGDDLRIMAAAERFLESSVLARDGRVERMEEMFSQAVVRATLDGSYPEEQVRMHVAHYRELVNPDRETAQ
jgi:hypothetical protein